MKLSARISAARSARIRIVALLLVAGTAVAGIAQAQSTGGTIFGHGPAGATVTSTSSSGAQRHITISGKGRYSFGSMPMGTYAVSLEKDGQTVDTRKNVAITVGRGQEVDFACPADNCAAAN